MNNDKGNIGIITNEREIENLQEQTKILFKVVDKLENRISTLEKVLASDSDTVMNKVITAHNKSVENGSYYEKHPEIERPDF